MDGSSTLPAGTMFNHKLYNFDSRLRLVVVPMESTKTATVLVMVGTGSKYETKEINGTSHFLEHMMFKGTEKRPGKLDIATELDGIGAEYNAFTGKEYTGYTTDLKQRLTDHFHGHSTNTSFRRPLILLFCEYFLSKNDATRREEYFKTSSGKRTLKIMLRDSLLIF